MALIPESGITKHIVGEGMSEVGANEAYFRLTAMAGAGFHILDRDLTAPPGSPNEMDVYLVASSPTGAWAGQAGKLAVLMNSAWYFLTPKGGWKGRVKDENIDIGYDATESAWYVMGDPWLTTEYWTGKKDGSSKIYGKAIDVGALPNATSSTDAHSIASLGVVKFMMGAADNGTNQIPIPNSGTARDVEIYIDDTNINLITTDDLSGYDGMIYLQYTKT